MRALFQRTLERLQAAWCELAPPRRIHLTALGLISALYIGHYLVFSTYFIEDAGISFAYARNMVEGEGLVTFAGGERVEGYSNPLWTFLIAAFYLVGVPVWTSSKILGAVLGVITLYVVYGITRRCRPGREDLIQVLPSLFLAASSVWVIWNGSGLENSLFNVLLAGGVYRVLVEGEREERGFPWSAVLFLGLATTRPEGIVYAAIGGFFRLVMAIRDRDVVRPIAAWLAIFWVPFLAYQAWRYSYFGWEFPNTYYAKLDGENRFRPWTWNVMGWKYVSRYMNAYFLSFALPLYAIGLAGFGRGRRGLILAMTAVGALLFLWDGRTIPKMGPDPGPIWSAWVDGFKSAWQEKPAFWNESIRPNWDKMRVGFLLGSAGLLTLLTALTRGALARLLVVGVGAAGLFFVVYSGGDWMKQWRWFNLVAVPNFVLLGLGVGVFAEHLPGAGRALGQLRGRTLWAGALTGLLLIPNIWNSAHAAPEPETTVADVRRRVTYMSWVQDRLHLDFVTLLDVDMGAHLWHTDWGIADIAGLVDVSMARHLYQKKFIQEYIFQERNPDFAHVHGGWANKSKINTHKEWKNGYIEIPGYPAGGKTLHVGNHIRKGIFVYDEYLGPPSREIVYPNVEIEGWDMPADLVPAQGKAYVEIWGKARLRRADFRVMLILQSAAGDTHAVSIPPGYDWYPPKQWRLNEHVVTRMDFELPEGLPEGDYDLALVLLDSKTGEVMLPQRTAGTVDGVASLDEAPGAAPEEPGAAAASVAAPIRYMKGAVWFADALTITNRDAATDEAENDRDAALALAAAGEDCDGAWTKWREARWHIYRNTAWHEFYEGDVRAAVSDCYAAAASRAVSEAEQIEALGLARRYDHHRDAVLDLARPLAARLDARGDAAAEEEDWEAAYAAWRDALILDPRLSATRRKAEDARDRRLGIDGKVKDAKKGARGRRGNEDEDEGGDEAEGGEAEGDEGEAEGDEGEAEGDEGEAEGDEDEAEGDDEAPPTRSPPPRRDMPELKRKALQGPASGAD